ncbi:MAG: ATPase [Gammaproteobacteria bacterium]|nr:ATPase [Gammaproteobacteria bacterium]OUT94347.1 MAG: ATPase [Gammaproteobacteria bacterium TMED36]|tara:strand:+ start:96 stop:932 length:837 start_codon:yes stop_codon:yes gene_type:complete
MKLSKKDFNDWKHKSITLLGMSGVGKTTLANKLPKSKWFHYSGDYRIGTKYLEEPILDNIKEKAMDVPFLAELLKSDSIYISSNITVDNLMPISSFLGKIGDRSKGGLSIDEFIKRQQLHMDAEMKAMKDVPDFIEKSQRIYNYDHFINDAGGSICELYGTESMDALVENTLILYIEADSSIRDELIKRAIKNPKPMFYTEDFLNEHLKIYTDEKNVEQNIMDPDDFVRWIFPKLLDYRKNKYEKIASEYGYTVSASDVSNIDNENEFLELIENAIGS